MQSFSYDISAYNYLMAAYFSFGAVLFVVSHVIKFLRDRS